MVFGDGAADDKSVQFVVTVENAEPAVAEDGHTPLSRYPHQRFSYPRDLSFP